MVEKGINTRSKDGLITIINEKHERPNSLVKKFIQQVKLVGKEDKIPLPLNWEKLTENLKVATRKWQRRQVEKVVNQFLEEIMVNLRQGKHIVLRNNFSLKIRRSAARLSRNPQTGQPMTIPERNRISFRASKRLKKEIN
jgi:DNA-binding protein HU-alpha